MSINVTVTGNPISIQRGGMVTANSDNSKKEYERRRLIRLSQVRQQSKNIAEDVRNRVRQEKLKQVEEIEKEGKKKLKQWQARKLLELQNQYHQALKDIGAGHKEASVLEDEADILQEQRVEDIITANKRASIASKKASQEKKHIGHNIVVSEQKQRLAKQLGNNRSEKKSLRKVSHKIKHDEGLFNETEVSGIVTNSDSEEGEVRVVHSPKFENKSTSTQINLDDIFIESNNHKLSQVEDLEKGMKGVLTDQEPILTLLNDDDQLLRELTEQKETRISERIRRRNSQQMGQSGVNDCPFHYGGNSTAHKLISVSSNEKVGTNIPKGYATSFPAIQQNVYSCMCNSVSPCQCYLHKKVRSNVCDINQLKCNDFTDEDDFTKKGSVAQNINTEKCVAKTFAAPSSPKRSRIQKTTSTIPIKPKVTLKSIKNIGKNKEIASPPLRGKSEQTKLISTRIEKIQEENLVISSGSSTEIDFEEKIKQRNREALLRGKKALEKEKLQREYTELMKKLPVLQKMEKLYEINRDKPEYHMSKDRIQEQERKKQNILDNTYEKLFSDRQPPTVTIPTGDTDYRKNKDTVSINDATNSLNLGAREADKISERLYTKEEVEVMLKLGKIPSEGKFRSDQLKMVLEKLRKQKVELLKEIQKLSDDPEQLTTISPISGKTKINIQKSVISTHSTETDSYVEREESKTFEETVKNLTKKVSSVAASKNSKLLSKLQYDPEEKIEGSKSFKDTRINHISNQVSTVLQSRSKKKRPTKEFSKSKSPAKIAKKQDKLDKKKREIRQQVVRDSKIMEKSQKDVKIEQSKQTEYPLMKESFTPSVPANSLVSVDEPVTKMQDEVLHPKRPFVSCDCERLPTAMKKSELCEIVIKIKDGKSSEVLITDKNKSSKFKNNSSIVKEPINIKYTQDHKSKETPQEIKSNTCCSSEKEQQSNSWHDKLSRNNSQFSNSSTSYLSPPHFPNKTKGESLAPPYFCQLIGRKPQQVNLSDLNLPLSTKIEANLLKEIKELLAMSRLSIDELGVSSVSTVTTPSQSIIDLESNNVHSSTKHINVDSQTTDHFDVSLDVQKHNGFGRFSLLTVSSGADSILPSEMKSSDEHYPSILSKYAEIADRCSERISNLSAMIEQVRYEKNKMLESPSLVTTNDSSTRYMDLPSSKTTKEDKIISISDSGNLLDINMSLAKKLKSLSKTEIQEYMNSSDFSNITVEDTNVEENLAKRFKALKEPLAKNDQLLPNTSKEQIQLFNKESNKGNAVNFTPLLQDIPKIPPLTIDSQNSRRKKPPPSKGILAARKLTDFAIPHELSTIPEQDSQTKLECTMTTKSPEATRKHIEIDEHMSQVTKSISSTLKELKKDKSPNIVNDNNKNEKTGAGSTIENIPVSSTLQSRSTSITLRDFVNFSDNSLGSSNTSGDEKSEMIRIETMLRSIGMDWAISTLRKTQEALALTSSSSSLELKTPTTVKNSNESGIKDYLAKQMFQKISSSTLKSDASPGSLNESNELSEIQGGNITNKQTSTPVNMSRELYEFHERSLDLPSVIESEKGTKEYFSLSAHSL